MYVDATRRGTVIIIEPVGSAPSTPAPKAVNATNGTFTVRIPIYSNTGASHDSVRSMVPSRLESTEDFSIDRRNSIHSLSPFYNFNNLNM